MRTVHQILRAGNLLQPDRSHSRNSRTVQTAASDSPVLSQITPQKEALTELDQNTNGRTIDLIAKSVPILGVGDNPDSLDWFLFVVPAHQTGALYRPAVLSLRCRVDR